MPTAVMAMLAVINANNNDARNARGKIIDSWLSTIRLREERSVPFVAEFGK